MTAAMETVLPVVRLAAPFCSCSLLVSRRGKSKLHDVLGTENKDHPGSLKKRSAVAVALQLRGPKGRVVGWCSWRRQTNL